MQVLTALPEAPGLQHLFERQLAKVQTTGRACIRTWACFQKLLGALVRTLGQEKEAFLARLAAARHDPVPPSESGSDNDVKATGSSLPSIWFEEDDCLHATCIMRRYEHVVHMHACMQVVVQLGS